MKKFYALLTALTATFAMSATSYELDLYPVDYSGTEAVTTSTPVKCNVDIDGNTAKFNNLLESEISPTFTFADGGATITCDLSNWQKSTYNLGTIGTGTEMYFEKNCGNYTTATWNAEARRFTFYSWVTLEGADDSDTYGFVVEMPDEFLNEITLNGTGCIWDYSANAKTAEEAITQIAYIKGGMVNLKHFLGSDIDAQFAVYDNGSVSYTTTDQTGYIAGTYTMGSYTFTSIYFDNNDYLSVSYSSSDNTLSLEGYAKTADGSYPYFYITLQLPDGFTPDEAPIVDHTGNISVTIDGSSAVMTQGSLSADGLFSLPNFLASGVTLSFQINTADDGSKSATPQFDTVSVPISVEVDGVSYTKLYIFGTSDSAQYGTTGYASVEDGQDYIVLSCYVYSQSYEQGYKYTYVNIYVPSEEAALRDDLLGKYTGNIGTYEYLYNYGSSPSYEYDGSTNAYVEFEAGEADNEVIIKNLIPTSYDRIHIESLTGKVASYNDYEGYKAYIEIEAGKVGTLDYYYGSDIYTLDAYIGASWLNNAYCSSPQTLYFYVADDGTIATDWTGWTIWMDWTGDGTTFYPAMYTGYNSDKLTKVDAAVNDITVDDSNAPVEYFNLNGVRLNGDNLTPGLYIRRQGSKATKLIIR